MSYNLDLRSKQYISRYRFRRSRPLWIALAITVMLSPILVYSGLNHYHQALVNRAANLESEVIMLRQSAKPLMIITKNLDNLQARRQLIDELKPFRKQWFAGLYLLYDAAPVGIDITGIEISGGVISIEGISFNMQSPAQYRQNLADLSLLEQTELKIMALNSNESYTFQIKVQLSKGDELNGYKENIAIQ